MKNNIEAMLQDMGTIPFIDRFYHGDKRFSLKASDFHVYGLNRFSDTFILPEGLIFNNEHNNYGLILTAPRKKKRVNVAIVGFNITNDILDCVYIAGARKRYRELCPIKWDVGLYQHLINLAKDSGAEECHLIPSHLIQSSEKYHGANKFASQEGNDPIRHGRLNQRYDKVAEYHGMKFDSSIDRYVMRV